MKIWQAPADVASAPQAYAGKAGITRTESLHLRQAGGALRSVQVYRVVNVATHPELRELVLRGQLNRLDNGAELAVPFVYHDPARKRFALVLPPSLAHVELKERAQLMTELADDSEQLVPEYVRDGATVIGIDELLRYLGEVATSASSGLESEATGRPSLPLAPASSRPSPANAARPGILAGLAQLLQSSRRDFEDASGSAKVAIRRLADKPSGPRIVQSGKGAPPSGTTAAVGFARLQARSAPSKPVRASKPASLPASAPPAPVSRNGALTQPNRLVAPVPALGAPAEPSTPSSSGGSASRSAVSSPAPMRRGAGLPPLPRPARRPTPTPDASVASRELPTRPPDEDASAKVTAASSPAGNGNGNGSQAVAVSGLVADAAQLDARLAALPLLGMLVEPQVEAVRLYVRVDEDCADVYDDEAELLIQWLEVAGRPLVVLALVGAWDTVCRLALDGLEPATKTLVERLAQDFRAELVVCVDGVPGEARPIFAPRELNARAIAARLVAARCEPEISASDAIVRCLAAPPPTRDPKSPFGPARLPTPSPATVLASIAQLEGWHGSARREEALFVYSVPKHITDAWYRRVLRSALTFGIAVPESLTDLLLEQQLAPDRKTFVQEQLTAFRTRVEHDQNDLDPRATERNWNALLSQAQGLGLTIESDYRALPAVASGHSASP